MKLHGIPAYPKKLTYCYYCRFRYHRYLGKHPMDGKVVRLYICPDCTSLHIVEVPND